MIRSLAVRAAIVGTALVSVVVGVHIVAYFVMNHTPITWWVTIGIPDATPHALVAFGLVTGGVMRRRSDERLLAFLWGVVGTFLAFTVASSTFGLAVFLGPAAAVLIVAGLLLGLKAFHGGSSHVAAFLLGGGVSGALAFVSRALLQAWDCANPPPFVGIGRYASCMWNPPWSTTDAGLPTFWAFAATAIAAFAILGFYAVRRPASV
jgi:hypothetical protein